MQSPVQSTAFSSREHLLALSWSVGCAKRRDGSGLYVTAAINVFGEALEAGSINIGMFLAARFIAGWGIGAAVVLIPIYQAEICEPMDRIIG